MLTNRMRSRGKGAQFLVFHLGGNTTLVFASADPSSRGARVPSVEPSRAVSRSWRVFEAEPMIAVHAAMELEEWVWECGWQARSGSRGWPLTVSEHEKSKSGATLVMAGSARRVFAFVHAVAAARGETGIPDGVYPDEIEAASEDAKRIMAKAYAVERAKAEAPEIRARKARSAAILRKSASASLGGDRRNRTKVALTGANVAPEDAKDPIAHGLADLCHRLADTPERTAERQVPAEIDFTRQLDARLDAAGTGAYAAFRLRAWGLNASEFAEQRCLAEGYEPRGEGQTGIAL
jgi:hypothetical protein